MYPGTYAATAPDRPALIAAGSGDVVTYAQLEDASARLANVFRDEGMQVGDVVALLTDNDPRAFEVYWAALRSGLYVTTVNRHLAPAEVAYIVNDSGARAVVVSGALGDLAEAVAAETPQVRLRLAYGRPVAGHLSFAEALAAASPAGPDHQPRGSDLLYSSGTTGRPKGIMLPRAEVDVADPAGAVLAQLTRAMYGFGEDTVYLSPAPVYHAAPLRFSAAVQALGGTVVIMDRFEPEAALATIERYRVTHSQWVPTMFIRMLKLPAEARTRHDLSTHRVAIHAAAPCPVEVKLAMIDWWGPILYEYYASTEGHGITFVDSAEWLKRPGTVGRAGLGVIHICDDDGRDLPVGEDGTVYFERDATPFTYHGDPEKSRAAQHPQHDNWTTVGDLGHLDDEGYLYLTDRKAFMIISGGVNIYPQEVENVLALHPKVLDVAVIGVPDPEMGEAVKAVVQPAPGVIGSPELERELLAYVRERIAHYKAPRSVDFADDLPRTPTGKLVKAKLRARYWPAVS